MIEIKIHSEAVVARLSSMTDRVRKAVRNAVTSEAIRMQGLVKAKLAGPVLNERTHHLHDSIHFEVTDDAHGVTAIVGTDVKYAAYHEYGFHGTEQVRQHQRRISMVFGHPIATVTATIRAHARKVDYAGKSFMRSTLAEEAGHISDVIRAAIGEGVRE